MLYKTFRIWHDLDDFQTNVSVWRELLADTRELHLRP